MSRVRLISNPFPKIVFASLFMLHVAVGVSAQVITVAPSGDITGATDSASIEDALRDMPWCGRVLLSDGDPETVDQYFTNRVIVAEQFCGTVTGESAANTRWMMLPNDPSAYLYDSDYIDIPGNPGAGIWATGLHFEWPYEWTLQKMSMIAADPVDGGQTPGGYFQTVAAWGGEGANTVRDMHFSATPGTTAWVTGPHIMRGSTRNGPGSVIDGVGDVKVTNSHFENLGDAIIVMWFRQSKIAVRNNTTNDVEQAVYLEGFLDSTADVKDNVFENGRRGVSVLNAPHTSIKENVFRGFDSLGAWWRAPIAIFRDSHDITVRENAFYEVTNVDTDGVFPDGAGGVLVWSGGNSSNFGIDIRNNDYDAMDVAIRTYVSDVYVCEEDLAAAQVVGTVNFCVEGRGRGKPNGR